MRILGFKRWQILIAFMLESLVIAFVGGFLGCVLGSFFDGMEASSQLQGGAGSGKSRGVAEMRLWHLMSQKLKQLLVFVHRPVHRRHNLLDARRSELEQQAESNVLQLIPKHTLAFGHCPLLVSSGHRRVWPACSTSDLLLAFLAILVPSDDSISQAPSAKNDLGLTRCSKTITKRCRLAGRYHPHRVVNRLGGRCREILQQLLRDCQIIRMRGEGANHRRRR